jgi:hypothetical protein
MIFVFGCPVSSEILSKSSSISGGTLKAIRFLVMLPNPFYVATQYYSYLKNNQIFSWRGNTPQKKP